MKFTLAKAKKFGWEGIEGWSYNAKEHFLDASAAYFELKGNHGRVKSTKSNRVYLIIEGEGEFIIDKKKFSVKQTDVIIVPKNTFYDYKSKKGTLKLFLVHTPAFDERYEVNKK